MIRMFVSATLQGIDSDNLCNLILITCPVILGGRMDMFHLSPEKAIAGIFIKNVLAESPAGRSGVLKTGDRILQVGRIVLQPAAYLV